MKKIILLSAVTLLLTAGANAQDNNQVVKNDVQNNNSQEMESKDLKIDKREARKELRKLKGNEVSYFAKQAFYKDFGNIPVSNWERRGAFDEATYTQNGQTYTAFYDDKPELVGTTSERKFSDLPARAQQYIDKKYPDYKVMDVLFYDDNELNETDMILYNIQFDDVDSYFVQLKKDNKDIVLQVSKDGDVGFFTSLNY